MKVTKMHGLGNCYVYIDEREVLLNEAQLPRLAVAVSDVRKGIGSDGLILIGLSSVADVRMRIFNADGSEAENCGNGVRCVAKYAYEHGIVGQRQFRVETKSGVVHVQLDVLDSEVRRVTVNMGRPRFGTEAVNYAGPPLQGNEVQIDALGHVFAGTLVSMGNPHFVTFVEDALSEAVHLAGPVIERHAYFPDRLNVEFVTARTRSELDFRVWERGSGITYACGTGACASVAVGVAKGLLNDCVRVHLLGGDLDIEMAQGEVYMTGEAVTVVSGEYMWTEDRS